MYIIAGTYKGRKIYIKKDTNIRPTTSRVREAVFNILLHSSLYGLNPFFKNEEIRFLDVFSGYGGMTLEALSRGVDSVVAIDKEPYNIENLEFNLEKFGIENNVHLICTDIFNIPIAFSKQKSNLCYMDPPYKEMDLIVPVLLQLHKKKWLSFNALIIIETDSKFTLNCQDSKIDNLFSILEERSYSKTKLLFMEYIFQKNNNRK